jgi:hypothetical protein
MLNCLSMFFQLLYIHLFRPFLKYNPNNSPLPAHVSPRKLCTTAAGMISKLLRLYKRSHGLRQICNIAVYIAHSACTIHLLNLPEKNAKRDIIHGVKHLEEIAEGWLCARRTLSILSVLAKKWEIDLPDEAATVLARTDAKFGHYSEVTSPKPAVHEPAQLIDQSPAQQMTTPPDLQAYSMPMANAAAPAFFDHQGMPAGFATSEALQHRKSEARSLPPNDSNSLAYPRAQRNPSTAASTTTTAPLRASFDNTTPSTTNSPSQLFGGVEQLMREGQDWWLRDQSQLAMGFDNWNMSSEEMAAWFNQTSQAAVGSPGLAYVTSPGVTGADVGGARVGDGMNGNANGGAGNGVNGHMQGFGGPLNMYNEQDWYQ